MVRLFRAVVLVRAVVRQPLAPPHRRVALHLAFHRRRLVLIALVPLHQRDQRRVGVPKRVRHRSLGHLATRFFRTLGRGAVFPPLRPPLHRRVLAVVFERRVPADGAGATRPPLVFPLVLTRRHRGVVKHAHGVLPPVPRTRPHRFRGVVLPLLPYVAPLVYFARFAVAGMSY